VTPVVYIRQQVVLPLRIMVLRKPNVTVSYFSAVCVTFLTDTQQGQITVRKVKYIVIVVVRRLLRVLLWIVVWSWSLLA
jgi:hypothetical protein